MSDFYDSDCSSTSSLKNNYCKDNRDTINNKNTADLINHKKKRRIVMKIEIDNSDETTNDESGDDGNVKSCTGRKSKRYFISSSSENVNSSGSEITQVRSKSLKKIESSDDENDCISSFPPLVSNGFDSDSSTNELLEKCPICLLTFRNQEIGSPSVCNHMFCARCIEEWSKNVHTCPFDRLTFDSIIVRDNYQTKTIVREIKVDQSAVKSLTDFVDDEITFCELCRLSDREDVMLLCDSCNQGYHIDCLTPVLNVIPEGSWYCDNCFDSEDDIDEDINFLYEDMREMGIPETRLTITELHQPRILRTRQNERIRATIIARTRSTRQSTSNTFYNDAVPSTSSGIRTNHRKKIPKKNTAKKTKKPVKRRRSRRTYVVEYDINNFDEKFELKPKKKLVRRRRKTRKSKKTSLNNKASNRCYGISKLSASKRLAKQFGVPSPSQEIRDMLPSSNFSLFGAVNNLEYFSDDNEIFSDIEIGGGSTAVQTSMRITNLRSGHRNRKEIHVNLNGPTTSTHTDLVSSILEMQDRWNNSFQQMESLKFETDGSITFNNTNLGEVSSKSKVKTNNVNATDITQAPMYPRGNNQNYNRSGNNGNYNNNRFNHQNHYRSGNQYRNSFGNIAVNTDSAHSSRNSFSNRENNNFQSNNTNLQNFFNLNERDRLRQRNNRNSNNSIRNQNSQSNLSRSTNLNNPRSNLIYDNGTNIIPRYGESIESTRSNPNDGSPNISFGGVSESNLPVYGPLNYEETRQESEMLRLTQSSNTDVTPPLAPPPWNKTLFQLTAAYADDEEDDSSNCPNFSVYSVESQQVANASFEQEGTSEQPVVACTSKEDEDEDLIQLGDDDLPIEQDQTNNLSLCKSDNSTDRNDDVEQYKKVDESGSVPKNLKKNDEDELESSSTNAEESSESYGNNKPMDSEGGNKKGILELYDDSDWEELNIDKNSDTSKIKYSPDKYDENNDNNLTENSRQNNKIIENNDNDCDPDRSYTPCLDENENPNDHDERRFLQDVGVSTIPPMPNSLFIENMDSVRSNEPATANIGGIETELISEDDSDQSEKKKDIDNEKNSAQQQFKKITKNQRGRNYRREKSRESPTCNFRRSRSQTNDKENEGEKCLKKNDSKRVRRQELPRYDVRNVIGQQPRVHEDRFGRNTSRPPRSKSRSRRRRNNSRSRSKSFSQKRKRRSFSISPSPNGHVSRHCSHRRFTPRRSPVRYRNRSPSPLRRRLSSGRRRSRSPLRIRSRTTSKEKSDRKVRRSRRISPLSKSKTPSVRLSQKKSPSLSSTRRVKSKRKRSRDRKKRKIKKRSVSLGLHSRHTSRDVTPVISKSKRHHISKHRSPEQAWSPSPSPETSKNIDASVSWTPPLSNLKDSLRLTTTTVIVNNKHKKEKKKRDKKRRKAEKRRDVISSSRKEKRRRRISEPEGPIVAPSKEVFASGNNILVSVSFNKDSNPAQQTTVVTLPPTREEVISGNNQRSRDRQIRRSKKPKEKQIRKHKKTDTKPVAIIDLERSPFQVTQPSNDIIILTDSEGITDEIDDVIIPGKSKVSHEHHQTETINSLHRSNAEKSPILDRLDPIVDESFEIQQFGPKTPPEPPTVKFAISNKSKQIKSRNPLHDDGDDNKSPIQEQLHDRQDIDVVCGGSTSIPLGPNTPSDLGPCSPDAYDPFDPTKSPSMSPHSPTHKNDSLQVSLTGNEMSTEDKRETRNIIPANQEKSKNSVELVMTLMGSKTNIVQTQDLSTTNEKGIQFNSQTMEDEILEDSGSIAATGSGTAGSSSGGADSSNIQVLSNVLISGIKPQQIPTIASPVLKTQSLISKLPLPKVCNNSRTNGSGNGCGSSNINDESLEIESPYSPSPADYEDLFEPPPDNHGANVDKKFNYPIQIKKSEMFDNLFGSSPGHSRMSQFATSTGRKQRPSKCNRKTSIKVVKLPGDDHIKLYDDVPNSAVELQVKDKYLRKLNRQERVVEEVKLVLKPHYNKKYITKEDYKDIMRKSVPKICHSKSGEINPKKIQNLIEAYVKKYRQKNKLNLLNTQGQVSSAVKCAAYLKKL